MNKLQTCGRPDGFATGLTLLRTSGGELGGGELAGGELAGGAVWRRRCDAPMIDRRRLGALVRLPEHRYGRPDAAMRRIDVTGGFWFLVAVLAMGLAGCSGIDLDPTTHREFPRTENSLAAPPSDLGQR